MEPYLRTHEGWLFLSVIMDLFSRQIIGYSMRERMTSNRELQASLIALWRRKSHTRNGAFQPGPPVQGRGTSTAQP